MIYVNSLARFDLEVTKWCWGRGGSRDRSYTSSPAKLVRARWGALYFGTNICTIVANQARLGRAPQTQSFDSFCVRERIVHRRKALVIVDFDGVQRDPLWQHHHASGRALKTDSVQILSNRCCDSMFILVHGYWAELMNIYLMFMKQYKHSLIERTSND